MSARLAVACRTGMTVTFAVAAMLLAACGPKAPQPHQRMFTDDLAIQIWMDPAPPRALEDVQFRVVVRDKKTGEPVEGGQGQVYATNEDRKSVDNGFEKGPELGTYYSKLMFVTAGPWAIAMRFRRDSTAPLQTTNDWMQQVYPETPPGTEGKK